MIMLVKDFILALETAFWDGWFGNQNTWGEARRISRWSGH